MNDNMRFKNKKRLRRSEKN